MSKNRNPSVPTRPLETFHRHGRYLGYPDCCIDAFCKLDHLGKPNRKLWGTGFVPCETCDKTKSKEDLIAEIERNRLSPIPFPKAPCCAEDYYE